MIASIVSSAELSALKVAGRVRPRLNLHQSADDPVQKMIVVMRQGEERKPHANARELTQFILEGHGYLLIYDDAGKEIERFHIGRNTIPCYTLPPNTWHTKKIYSESMTFIEIMKGPYLPGDVREL